MSQAAQQQVPKITSETKQAALKQFDQILKRAIEKKASDVHLKTGLPAIVRVNGHLFYLGEGSSENISRLTSQQLSQLALTLLNPRQLERYELGEEIDLGYEVQGSGRFRINICQQRSNPRIVCRFIPDQIKTLEELGVPPHVHELTAIHRGLILVTGATGSGKSTTLAAMIDHIARSRSCHILTIEDPVEFSFKDRKSIITQREIGLDTSTFARALKYALRQDPDVILVGEMRDEETITMALSAAETGHLVLSTLHTTNAPETINRILGSVSHGAQAQVRAQLASTLIGVVSQRLVRRKDGKGRAPAVELLINNQRVRDMIADPARTGDIMRVIEESNDMGMQTFDQSLMALLKAEIIDREEALNHCTNPQDFQLRLEGVVGGGGWAEKQEKNISRSDRVKAMLENGAQLQEIQIEENQPKKKR